MKFQKKLENCKVLIRSFSGPKVACMKDHMKPSMRENPDHIILHIEADDLNGDGTRDLIPNSIIDLDITMKSDFQNISISNFIIRTINLNDKAMEVNGHIKRFCIEKNISFDRPYKNFPSKTYQ